MKIKFNMEKVLHEIFFVKFLPEFIKLVKKNRCSTSKQDSSYATILATQKLVDELIRVLTYKYAYMSTP